MKHKTFNFTSVDARDDWCVTFMNQCEMEKRIPDFAEAWHSFQTAYDAVIMDINKVTIKGEFLKLYIQGVDLYTDMKRFYDMYE